MKKTIPEHIIPFFWSYNPRKIDIKKHKKLIIAQILNYGDKPSTDWLFKTYNKKEVAEIAKKIPAGQWDKKSLNFWSLILNIKSRERINK